MPFELSVWIPVESDEPDLYETLQEALDNKASQELMQPENRYEIINTDTEEVIHPEALLQARMPVTDRKVICPHCSKNLLEVGIDEVLDGGTSYTPIEFSKTGASIGVVSVDHFQDQWVKCKGCNENILELHAIDVVDFNDGCKDDIEGIETHITEKSKEE